MKPEIKETAWRLRQVVDSGGLGMEGHAPEILDDIRTLVETFEALAPRPIETAPKDGSRILLFWQYTYHDDLHPTCDWECGEWDEDKNEWVTDTEDMSQSIITHWAPLPDPPLNQSSATAT